MGAACDASTESTKPERGDNDTGTRLAALGQESQGIERIDWRIACLTDKISSKFIKIINYESIEKIDHSGTTETGTCSALEIQCCGSFGVRVIVVSW